MDIRAEKLLLIQWLLRTEDEKILEKIRVLLNESLLKPISEAELERKLQNSEEDIKEGRILSHKDVVTYFNNKH
jgi:hypothetical protein